MNEVSTQIVALLLDALEPRGLDPDQLWQGLPISRARVRDGGRIDWTTWVEMMARVEHACGPDQTELLFVPGAGARTGHRFVQVASGFLTVQDLYAVFARWGVTRQMMAMTGRFEAKAGGEARLTLEIDRRREGSLPTLRFCAGVIRSLPMLQDLPPATCRIAPGATPHQAGYQLVLPRERSRFARARRLLKVAGGASVALDELEQQATEIAVKNVALEEQLAETAKTAAVAAEREEWLRQALDAGRVGIWRWDPSRRRVRLSDELGALLGLPGQVELDTRALTQRIHPDDRQRLGDCAAAAIERGEPFDVECRVFRASGELSWIQIKGRAIDVPGASGLHAVGTVADLTEQKLLDHRLRFADRLIAAGSLAAGVAHEINNPLGYVLGSLELVRMQLRDVAVAPLVRDSLAQMGDGLERIRDVVSDLRAFARPEEDVVTRTAPRAVCEAAIRIVSSLVRHRAEVTTDFAADTPAVIANQSRLGQVLINLIVNASHALPARPVAANRITVRTRRLASGEVAIAVTDNGSGIAPELVPRLFDPFFTARPDGLGTGLGLAVCQRIVGSLHGRIDVESVVGEGSTFTIVMPAAPAAEPARVVTPPPVAAAGPRRVLVIDDEPMLRRVLGTMLAHQGFVVVQADGGRAGLAHALGDQPFDIILCDLMMPDLDGVALHAELVQQRPALIDRMVFMSGGAVSDRTRAFIGRDDIVLLAKPFTLDHLLAVLLRVPAA